MAPTLALTRRFVLTREIGKAGFLLAMDGMRAGARAIGAGLADEGLFADPEDVFFLTFDESLADPRADDDGPRTGTVTGMGVSAGEVEGTVQVIDDADSEQADDFEPGDVLVCRITDPSWAPLLSVAAAVVIDIGGSLSHGAIVARELGIPCVINTVDGTRALRTGDRVTVDGAAGTVSVISALQR